jgi:hypothetical protein
MSFQPKFQDFVVGIAPNGVTFSISPSYCLSRASATELKAILSELSPELVDGPPVPNRGGRFQYPNVPFLKFPDGKIRNAGVLATYWTWFPSLQAEKACRADIADSYTGEELL